jgi:hypothetical protein
MSRSCRVLQRGKCEITQGYKSTHQANDLVGAGYTLDNIVAHSDGIVVGYRNNYATNDKTGNSYGNYVKIKHDNNYYTLYAHMVYKSVKVKTGDKVKKGELLGSMGNTGHSSGAHLHFEVRRGDNLINPTTYLTEDLPKENKMSSDVTYKIGDVVNINAVYVSSESTVKLKPSITTGTITKIIKSARNPYLLDNGNIGWINDKCIFPKTIFKTIINCSYLNLRSTSSYGNNIYTSVKSGTKVEYLGIENGWAKVIYNNKTLYCGVNYLK